MGAFYAVSVFVGPKILLLNPCLDPETAIPKILYPEQKKDFDEERAVREWNEIKKNWNLLDREDCGMRFGVFSDKDESQLSQALSAFKKYGEQAGKVIAGQSSFCFDDEFVI